MDLAQSKRAAGEAWLRHWTAGPQRLRWRELPVQPGDSAPRLILPSSAGEPYELGQAWQGGPAVLVFLRHFGCSCAFDRAKRLVDELPALAAAGATVIAIGQGDPLRARAFAAATGLACPLLCDEGRRAYEAYGLLEARPSQVVYGLDEGFLRHDPAVGAAFRDSRQGTGREPVDSPWQLPGDFVVNARGQIVLAYRPQYCEDYPDRSVLLSAVAEAKLGL